MWDRQASGFTNGMCLGPDGTSLFVVESTPPLISRVPINEDGTAGEREVVVELSRNVPDGVAFEVQGKLYISLYNPNIIYRYDLGKKALETLRRRLGAACFDRANQYRFWWRGHENAVHCQLMRLQHRERRHGYPRSYC